MIYILVIGLTTLLVWSIINILSKKRIKVVGKVIYRQSNIYEIIKHFIPKELFEKPTLITQSRKHAQKNMLKVIIDNGKAYWIQENVFYIADSINGIIDRETIKPLDTNNMSKKDLEKMLDILDSLRRGVEPNDSGSSGNE